MIKHTRALGGHAKRLLTIVTCLVLLAGCGGQEEERTELTDLTDAYTKARESVARGNYRRGIEIY